MSKRVVQLLICDMLEAIDRIDMYVRGLTDDQFYKDSKTSDAVVRNIEIIGEAANRLPEDFKSQHVEMDWRKVVGLRNRIVHDYFGIDLQIIWNIIVQDLPELKQILSQFKDEES